MRSIIIIEVDHGETTDDVEAFIRNLDSDNRYSYPDLDFVDVVVRVDVPAAVVLDSDMPSRDELFKAASASPRVTRVPVITWDETGTKKVSRY